MKPYPILAILMSVLGTGLASGQTRPAAYDCVPQPAVRRALNELPETTDHRVPYDERMKPLRALLTKYPRDIFVQMRYQDGFKRDWWLHEEFDRAFAMYRSRPNDPVFRYLEGRLTGVFHAAKAEEMLNALIAGTPGFPWPRLAIAELTDRSGAGNAKKAEAHLRAFISACPAAADGYAMLRTVENPEMVADGAVKLRSLLEAARDNWSLPFWRHLWDLEFRAVAAAEHDTVRQRVARDANTLARNPATDTREWLRLFEYAAQLTKDQSIQNWLDTTVLERFPGTPLAASIERNRWLREHQPPQGAKPDDLKAFRTLQAAWQAEFDTRYRDTPAVIIPRFRSLSSSGQTLPPAERLSIVDRFLTLRRDSPDSSWESPAAPLAAAAYYVGWGTRLDQVLPLVQAGLKQAELENTYRLHPTMYPVELRKTTTDWANLSVLARTADSRGPVPATAAVRAGSRGHPDRPRQRRDQTGCCHQRGPGRQATPLVPQTGPPRETPGRPTERARSLSAVPPPDRVGTSRQRGRQRGRQPGRQPGRRTPLQPRGIRGHSRNQGTVPRQRRR